MDTFCGLDLGRYTDFCALSMMTRELSIDSGSGLPVRDHRGNPHYFWQIRALRRWPLRTPYSEVIKQVVRNVTRPDINPRPRLVVDHSGVGTAILDQVRHALSSYQDLEVWGITITAGDTWKMTAFRTINVAKTQLTSNLAEALGNERVYVCPRADGSKMENQEILERELAAFKIRVSKTGYQSVEAMGSDHDDCAVSIALPLWLGNQNFMHMRHIGSASRGDIYLRPREVSALEAEQIAIERAEAESLKRERAELEKANERAYQESRYQTWYCPVTEADRKALDNMEFIDQ
jgi:hypothetical protein